MKSLPLHPDVPAPKSARVTLVLLTTETTALTAAETDSFKSELPLERALHQRATAMTDLLTRIMDRPITPRFWGRND